MRTVTVLCSLSPSLVQIDMKMKDKGLAKWRHVKAFNKIDICIESLIFRIAEMNSDAMMFNPILCGGTKVIKITLLSKPQFWGLLR